MQIFMCFTWTCGINLKNLLRRIIHITKFITRTIETHMCKAKAFDSPNPFCRWTNVGKSPSWGQCNFWSSISSCILLFSIYSLLYILISIILKQNNKTLLSYQLHKACLMSMCLCWLKLSKLISVCICVLLWKHEF